MDQVIGKLSNAGGDALALVHVDEACIVADKPAGLLCVPGRGADKQDCLSARVQARFPDALVVHRLDMATSGLCLFARGAAMQRQFSEAFAGRQVHKLYVAVIAGRPAASQGAIDLPIGADWADRPRRRIDPADGKPSLTRWRVIGPGPLADTTRVELEPVTGRTHQLRVHLAAVGHPIVGDALYAAGAVAEASPRLLLHASELRLAHLQLASPPPF